MADTIDIKGVEILAVGEWLGVSGGKQKYTRADLQEFADAGAAAEAAGIGAIKVSLGGKVSDALAFGNTTIGHNDVTPDGRVIAEAPRIGTLANLRVKGDRLLGDIVGVPVELAKAIGIGYPDRSIEAIRLNVKGAIEIGGKKFSQIITGLALLGESLPAVKGLADLPAVLAGEGADGDAAAWVLYTRNAEADPTPGAPTPTDLDAFVEALESVFSKYSPLIYGRRGGPRARSLFSAFVTDIRASARPFLSEGGSMVDRSKVLEIYALAADATTADVLGAVKASTPDQAAGLVRIANAMEFASADSFVAWLAGMLGVGPADLGAIAGAVAEALGKSGAPMVDPATEGTEGGELPMAQASEGQTTGGDAVTVVKLSEQLSKTTSDLTNALTRLAALEGARASETAEAMVEREYAQGKFLPPQRETLIQLAKTSPDAFRALADGQPVLVKLGERGVGGTGVDAGVGEPSAADIAAMVTLGYEHAAARDILIANARAEAGLPPLGK